MIVMDVPDLSMNFYDFPKIFIDVLRIAQIFHKFPKNFMDPPSIS